MKPRMLHYKLMAGLLLAAAALSASAQTLTVTDNLQLWLKADEGITANAAGKVSGWKDFSGKLNDAVQGNEDFAPVVVNNALNNKPVLRFDGVDDYLEVTDSDSVSIVGDITSFFVVKFDDFATFRAVWGKTDVNLPAPTDFYTLPNTGIPQVYRGDGTGANLGAVASSVPLRAGTYLVVGFDMAGTQLTHYLNAQATGTGTIPAALGDTDKSLFIGTRGDFFTKMKGDIAEVLIYDRALSAADRNAVVNYLGVKYNIQNLPPTVTVKVTPPGPAVALGDAVTVEATASDPDGSIARVEFLVNGARIATASAPPYRVAVTLESAASYEFSARAVDNKDSQATSAGVTVSAAGAANPSLAVKEGLQLWLQADAGVTAGADGLATEWADQSGKGNNASQADPALAPMLVTGAVNGKPALRFDGADDYLDVTDSDSVSIFGDITSLFVVKMDDFATFRSVWGKTQGNLPAPTDYYTLPNSGIPRLYRGNASGSLGSTDGGTALRAGMFELAGFTAAGAETMHHLNGRVTGAAAINATFEDRDTALKIGSRDDLFTKLKGDLAELLIYDRALSAADRRSAELYLAGKYGLAFTSVANMAPTAAITEPASAISLTAPASLTVKASAADADGSIVRVAFLLNGEVVGTSTAAPYSTELKFNVADNATVTVMATDNLGATTTSAPLAVTVTSAVQSPLPAMARLRLWLAADKGVTAAGGSVSAWEDQSGNLNHAAQADAGLQPQLIANAVNNRPAIYFDGEDDYLTVAHSPTVAIVGDITTFFVVKFEDFETFRAVWAKTQGNVPRATDFYTLPGTGIPRVFRGGTGEGFSDGTNPLVAGEYALVGFTMEGTTLRHYLNGEPNGEGRITAPLGDTGAPLIVGSRGDLFTKMKGEIAEIVIYNSSLSTADRETVVSYLGGKYAIQVPAPLPRLSASLSGNSLTLSWPPGATGFSLESATSLPAASWTTVTGVVNNSVTVTIGTGSMFFRLVKP